MNETKLNLHLRAATDDDYELLLELDHSITSEYVWQMDLGQTSPRMGAQFRETRLPRSMKVDYPRSRDRQAVEWKQRAAVLIGEAEAKIVGYASLASGLAPGAIWITDLVVDVPYRRKGVGTRLLSAAQSWAREHGHDRLVLEMQSKNYPAIKLAEKLAFEFSGYNDKYYENQDIALFFAKRLR
jgi:ribosomal protein S18 acetylase RimI-like enzyme